MRVNAVDVQKIQQITILKNRRIVDVQSDLFKKYNKLQSLRTQASNGDVDAGSKNTTNYNP